MLKYSLTYNKEMFFRWINPKNRYQQKLTMAFNKCLYSFRNKIPIPPQFPDIGSASVVYFWNIRSSSVVDCEIKIFYYCSKKELLFHYTFYSKWETQCSCVWEIVIRCKNISSSVFKINPPSGCFTLLLLYLSEFKEYSLSL